MVSRLVIDVFAALERRDGKRFVASLADGEPAEAECPLVVSTAAEGAGELDDRVAAGH